MVIFCDDFRIFVKQLDTYPPFCVKMSEKMEGILVFDHTNDLIYQHLNDALKGKMIKQGKKMGILDESETFVSRSDI